MKTDLEYLYCILSLLDKNSKNHWNEYHRTNIQIDNILQFEDFFKDWSSIYLFGLGDDNLNKINFHFRIYCYFFYLNNKDLFKNDNDYISSMIDYSNTTLASFKEVKDKNLMVMDYINEDIISKTKFYIRRIKLKELINEN